MMRMTRVAISCNDTMLLPCNVTPIYIYIYIYKGLTCEVGNCVLCVDEVDTCELCAEGHGVSPDRKKCIEEDITVFVFGKGHYDAQNEFLAPNVRRC